DRPGDKGDGSPCLHIHPTGVPTRREITTVSELGVMVGTRRRCPADTAGGVEKDVARRLDVDFPDVVAVSEAAPVAELGVCVVGVARSESQAAAGGLHSDIPAVADPLLSRGAAVWVKRVVVGIVGRIGIVGVV